MVYISKYLIGYGIGCAFFIGLCLYFDRKRRNDHNFKSKLREWRKAERKSKEITTTEEKLNFFIREIERAKECISEGDKENGIRHWANALAAVPSESHLILRDLIHVMSSEIFYELLQELKKRLNAQHFSRDLEIIKDILPPKVYESLRA